MKLELERLTETDIAAMSYNELIGLTRETNRPPGGNAAIGRIAQAAFLRPGDRVLEIGTSTGITAIELARLTAAHVCGIDINLESLAEAERRARRYGVQRLTQFRQADATKLPDADGSFDLVFCGNVTSLIANREQALAEYTRVLREGGLLAAIPMYYLKPPAEELLERVRAAIRVPIQALDRAYWLRFFSLAPLELYRCEDYAFDDIPPAQVDAFAEAILARPHLQRLAPRTRAALGEKYREQLQLFRTNLAHMGYSILLLRKEPEEVDRELFTSRRIRAA